MTEKNEQQQSILLSLIKDYCYANGMEIGKKNNCVVIKYHQITDINHPSLDKWLNLYLNIYRMRNGKYIAKASNHGAGVTMNMMTLIEFKGNFNKVLRKHFKEGKGKRVIEEVLFNTLK